MSSLLFTDRALAQGSMEEEILVLVNKHRKKQGLPAMEMHSAISKEAEQHSRNMAVGHVGFGHSGFDERLRRLMKKIAGSNAGAENVAYGSRTAEEVVRMWLNSPGHRKNIQGNYNLTGIGVVRGKGEIFYTQIFIRKRE